MKTYKLIVSTPDGNLYDNEVLEIALRGTEGDFAIRADHIPFITATVGGKMRITDPEGEDHIALVSDGILTVTKEKTTFMCMEFSID
jgi:F-type H+-transporting ATPase subunit epsilon